MKGIWKILNLAAKICVIVFVFLFGIAMIGGTIMFENEAAVNTVFKAKTQEIYEDPDAANKDSEYFKTAFVAALGYGCPQRTCVFMQAYAFQLRLFPVQEEAFVGCERYRTHAETCLIYICLLSVRFYCRFQCVEIRIVGRPQYGRRQRDVLYDVRCVARNDGQPFTVQTFGRGFAFACQYALRHFYPVRLVRGICYAGHDADIRLFPGNPRSGYIGSVVDYMHGTGRYQPYMPVDARTGVPSGYIILPRTVYADGDRVLSSVVQIRGQVVFDAAKAVGTKAQMMPVDVYIALVEYAVEQDGYGFPLV